jgi:hypothetical protein
LTQLDSIACRIQNPNLALNADPIAPKLDSPAIQFNYETFKIIHIDRKMRAPGLGRAWRSKSPSHRIVKDVQPLLANAEPISRYRPLEFNRPNMIEQGHPQKVVIKRQSCFVLSFDVDGQVVKSGHLHGNFPMLARTRLQWRWCSLDSAMVRINMCIMPYK